jgi:hypothetical protein
MEEAMQDYTPYQQKVIKRYYDQQGTIQLQRLAELVSELYLAEGKKRQKTWEAAATAMQKLGVPQARIDHLVQKANPALIAELVKELESKPAAPASPQPTKRGMPDSGPGGKPR